MPGIAPDHKIERLRRVMANMLSVPIAELADDMELYAKVLNYGDYSKIASKLGEERARFYKWFHDVYGNRIAEQLTAEDKELIRMNVDHAARNQYYMDYEYQQALKALLSRTYYTNVFTVFFNNAQRKYRPFKQLYFGAPLPLSELVCASAKVVHFDLTYSVLSLLERAF